MRGRKAKQTETPRPRCVQCENKNAMPSRKNKHGIQLWCKYCSDCAKRIYNKPRDCLYRSYKESKCGRCNFIPEDPCQLDVDHIDGNHYNNDPTNLQTLCANCHRLKTKQSKEGMYARH